MIVMLYWLVSEVGVKVLVCGGNVIEVLVVVGVVLVVVYLYFCGFGGDVVWMVVDVKGKV